MAILRIAVLTIVALSVTTYVVAFTKEGRKIFSVSLKDVGEEAGSEADEVLCQT